MYGFSRIGTRLGVVAVSLLSVVAASHSDSFSASAASTMAQDQDSNGIKAIKSQPRDVQLKRASSPVAPSTLHSPQSDSPIQITEGEGGTFVYQIWEDLDLSDYYLCIWEQTHAENEEPSVAYNFDSATEAMNFFTCRYAREKVAACDLFVASISYDVPVTCVFPWVACEEQ